MNNTDNVQKINVRIDMNKVGYCSLGYFCGGFIFAEFAQNVIAEI